MLHSAGHIVPVYGMSRKVKFAFGLRQGTGWAVVVFLDDLSRNFDQYRTDTVSDRAVPTIDI